MTSYSIPFLDVQTAVPAGQPKTAAAMIAANTPGHRGRLRSLNIGPADQAPVDKTVSVTIERVTSVSGGTAGVPGSTIAGASIPKKDSASLDAVITAGIDYGTEPTVFETHALFTFDMNTRSGLIKEWAEQAAPVCGPDQILAVRIANKDGVQLTLSGSLEFEQF